MRIAIVNSVFAADVRTPEATLDRFHTLTGWADALRGAGATAVDVHQRFFHDATIRRGGVVYRFCRDGRGARPPAWFAGSAAWHRALADGRPDVVHVNGLDHPRLLRRLRRRLPESCAIVAQDHGGFDPRALPPPRAWWMRRGLRAVDALLVAADGQIAAFRTRGLAPSSARVYDVMEASTTLGPVARSARGSPLALLWVGRLNANKDPLTVLRGVAACLRGGLDATLTFVYDAGDLERRVRQEVDADAGLRGRVRLVGAVRHDEMAAVYAAADVLVLGSHREGSGYAAIEALACGVIPVVTDIPSFRALTDDGRVGALWTTGDHESLRAAIGRVVSTPLGPQRDACRSLFEDRFSWPAIGRRALAIYGELRRA